MAVCNRCRSVYPEAAARFCPFCGVPASAAPASIGPGAELPVAWGKVVVGDLLGQGGMGMVRHGWLFAAPTGPRAGQEPRPVAVKILNPLLKARQRARDQFVREATALARLSHPNVVEFVALVEHGGHLAIVMEYVHGDPLSAVIARIRERQRAAGKPGCLPLPRAWHYFSQLLGGLAGTHAVGIVHRDIKPPNVLIRGDGLVKLTDFGIARLPADVARVTGGAAPGTGAYMAPEQVMAREIDGRADLYGAAIVLFEMLSGRTPFEATGRTEMQVRAAQIEESPPPLSALVPGLGPELDRILARALAKDPRHRFRDALEFGQALAAGLGLPLGPGWEGQRGLAAEAPRLLGLVEPFRESQLPPPPGAPTPGVPVAVGEGPPPASPQASAPGAGDTAPLADRSGAFRTAIMGAYSSASGGPGRG